MNLLASHPGLAVFLGWLLGMALYGHMALLRSESLRYVLRRIWQWLYLNR